MRKLHLAILIIGSIIVFVLVVALCYLLFTKFAEKDTNPDTLEIKPLSVIKKKEPKVETVKIIEPEIVVKDDPMLPQKSNFRPDEAAYYFDVNRSTIYNWIDNGILKATKIGGTIRIPREAILSCRFVNRLDPLA